MILVKDAATLTISFQLQVQKCTFGSADGVVQAALVLTGGVQTETHRIAAGVSQTLLTSWSSKLHKAAIICSSSSSRGCW